MKKLLSILIIMVWTLTMSAQTYSTLWKQVETAQEKDQPKSAIAALQKIEKKASKEKSYGNLLAAMIREVNQQAELSEDSMTACKKRLEGKRLLWRKNGQGVMTVLSGIALGEKFSVDSLLSSSDAKIYTKSDESAVWVPYIDKKTDSKYFHNDLLHVIGMECGEYASLYRYYTSISDRPAACIAATLMLSERAAGKKALAQCDSLIDIYKDLPECGALAKVHLNLMPNVAKDKVQWIDEALSRWPSWKENNELRNIRTGLTQAGFHAVLSSNIVNTKTPITIAFDNVRNISGVKVQMSNDKGQTKEYSMTMPKHEEWDIMRDSLRMDCLPLGKWTVTITDDSGKIKSAKQMLFVTDLKVIQIAQPGGKTKYVVVNAITGEPTKDAKVVVKDGNVSATLGEDTAMPDYRVWSRYGYSKPSKQQRYLNIYTDRSIYRPGQTVRVAVLRHDVFDGTTSRVTEGDTVKLVLRDSQGKQLYDRTVITDEYGTAAVDFTLPTDGRNGSYTIQGSGHCNGYANISVEEYKRPTYDVTLAEPSDLYKSGDTLSVLGTAKTYSGVAVANARVTYTVKRQMTWWWRRGNANTLLIDTVYTDADGRFTVRMPMVLDDDARRAKTHCFYNIVAEATVMDNGGESHSASLSLPLSNSKAYLSCDLKGMELYPQSHPSGEKGAITFTVTRRNASGKLIDGEVQMILDGKAMSSAKANQKYSLPKDIVSGEHKLQMICDEDTLEKTFVVFRKSDKTPVTTTKDWFYVSGDTFTTDGTWMQLGSLDRNVYVIYAIYSADKVLEEGTWHLDASNLTRTFKYKKEYGDGITISLAWVKDGKMYSHTASIKKALTDNKLTLQWESFRNKLVPGQKETWTLKVSDGLSGSMVSGGSLMAVLYDKSLDALRKHQWSFSDRRVVTVPYVTWSTNKGVREWFSANAERKNLPEDRLNFSSIAYDCRVNPYANHGFLMTTAPRMLLSKSVGKIMATNDGVSLESEVDNSASDPENITATGLRSEFAETAFFMPQLITDDNGVATISFTLPESVTTWKFMALAHDKDMRFGQLTDEAIAQKPLMLQAKMPRFLRVGDKGQITVNVSNLTDREQNINVSMTILDGKTEKELCRRVTTCTINTDATVPVTFDIDATESMPEGIICRFMAETQEPLAKHVTSYSDGEQYLLPILTEKEEKVDTTPFVVEPKKMVMEALPQLAVPTSNTSTGFSTGNAITLSNAIYANVMTAHLRDTIVSAANDNVLSQLLVLQNGDGGFSWYKGMESSNYITATVVKTLVRMNKICGQQNNTEFMLEKAFSYLEKEMQKEMAWQKEHKYKYLSSTALDWLYCLTLNNKKGGTSESYFRSMLYSQTVKDDMQTKAVAGIVMNNTKQAKKAREFAEAIKQHTVYREDMGRYFDSYRADYSWCDFRIPTQTMCIEALSDITPKDTTTITEMQKWIVQSKRTQRWDNAINAVNAVYALSLSKAQKPFMVAYTVNPEDYKDIIKVSRSFSGSQKVSKVGDKVKVTITIVADRDYDFVTVTDNRAACLEPVNQISGYKHSNQHDGYYQEMKDNKTVYHFNQLSKGTHTIETEYYIDRAGCYATGKTTAVCEYAPEFRGTAPETKIEVK